MGGRGRENADARRGNRVCLIGSEGREAAETGEGIVGIPTTGGRCSAPRLTVEVGHRRHRQYLAVAGGNVVLEVLRRIPRRDDPGHARRNRSADREMKYIVVRESAVAVIADLGTEE